MRQERIIQSSIFDVFCDHQLGRELKAISGWLDEHRELVKWVATDLGSSGLKQTGRKGLPAESVLRCALLKQHRQLTYEELAFHLEDSAYSAEAGHLFRREAGHRTDLKPASIPI
jgi:transposase, IS5 family